MAALCLYFHVTQNLERIIVCPRSTTPAHQDSIKHTV